MIRNNFHIFSGGPGAGKTTLLEALRAQGYAGVDEAARRVLREEAARGGNATHDGDRAAYRDRMLALGLADFHAVAETARPVFFDRGIPELSGYGNAPGVADPPALTRAIAECRYNPRVFLFPAWRAIYVHDELRKHSFEHAVAVHAEVQQTYRRFGYEIVEMPEATVEQRARFVLETIGAQRPP
jgi:predicted ATPase